ncbi:zinc ribbon domain-containing protein [Halorubrum amylolyticum]|uniref:zinc ribbon domain-containing protein n=1 Tax=Halorubrum amylolyticum TaxID=2508724 RepID=UPI0010092B4B|nr:zinc ribbon domain-containing protein [Halorubrum amylolyticum]
MVDPGLLYLAVIGMLLLVALGLGVRVLRGIVGDAREIRRKRRSGELEPYAEDEEYDRVPRDPAEGDGERGGTASTTCPQCGADNDAAFDYCRRCASPLRPGG